MCRINENKEENAPKPEVELSIYAFAAFYSPIQYWLRGSKEETDIFIIDSCSTHKFLDTTMLQTGSMLQHTSPLMVTVANGSSLASTGRCPNFQWTMQGHKFDDEVRVLSFGGCFVILGVEWLKRYSHMFDFTQLSQTFKKEGKAITVKGVTGASELSMINNNGFKRCLRKRWATLCGFFSPWALIKIAR